jgi:hypothetical protein
MARGPRLTLTSSFIFVISLPENQAWLEVKEVTVSRVGDTWSDGGVREEGSFATAAPPQTGRENPIERLMAIQDASL